MDWLIENWHYVFGSLVTIGTGVFYMVRWLHRIFVKEPIEKLKEKVEFQGSNYNIKFDETHEKIDDIKSTVDSMDGKLSILVALKTKG